MKGVVLAGGKGTRLGDSTRVTNKHLLPVYDQPMIYQPLRTLKAMGCTDILIVTSPEAVGGIAQLCGSAYTYRIQDTPNGIAGALACAEGYVDGLFPVILGDNYFSDPIPMPGRPALYLSPTDRPEAFGVYQQATCSIVEKPDVPCGNLAVTGLYVYDDRVFDIIRTLAPSARGELEITDVNNWYLSRGLADLHTLPGMWSDMGTPDTLLRTALHLQKAVTA